MLEQLVALLAPPRCAACRAPGRRATDVLCGACRRALPWLAPPRCERCALPLPHRGRCPARDAPFDAAWSAVAYEGVARDAMHALKFSAARPLADVMAAQIAANAPWQVLGAATAAAPGAGGVPEGTACGAAGAAPAGAACGAASEAGAAPEKAMSGATAAAALGAGAAREEAMSGAAAAAAAGAGAAPAGAACGAATASEGARAADPAAPSAHGVALVAVPPHPVRRRTRGFDPADLLARALARRTGLPLAPAALRRSAAPSRQLGADRETRRDAARLRFEARGPAPREAILVDDVYTTGATLAACAQALKAAGAERVVAVTWARTL